MLSPRWQRFSWRLLAERRSQRHGQRRGVGGEAVGDDEGSEKQLLPRLHLERAAALIGSSGDCLDDTADVARCTALNSHILQS